jgi:hypothetical protein
VRGNQVSIRAMMGLEDADLPGVPHAKSLFVCKERPASLFDKVSLRVVVGLGQVPVNEVEVESGTSQTEESGIDISFEGRGSWRQLMPRANRIDRFKVTKDDSVGVSRDGKKIREVAEKEDIGIGVGDHILLREKRDIKQFEAEAVGASKVRRSRVAAEEVIHLFVRSSAVDNGDAGKRVTKLVTVVSRQ